MRIRTLFLLGCLSFLSFRMEAQELRDKNLPEKWNIKSNLLYDATGTLNLGAEISLSDKWSFDLSGNYNGWTWSDNRKWKHWMVQPEVRTWLKESFRGHFFALHALGGQYNFGNLHFPMGLFKELRTQRHEGWYLGAGLGYGYRWNFSSRWGMEAEAAVGYIRFDYKKYECAGCGERLGTGNRNYIGPTKVALNLIYRFGKKTPKAKRPVTSTYVPETTDMAKERVEIFKRDTVIVVKEVPREQVSVCSADLYLQYKQGQTDLNPTFGGNATELARVLAMINEVKANEGARITKITVVGYASPEGDEKMNVQLSTGRATGVRDYLKRQLPDGNIVAMPSGEDWKGLQQHVEKDSQIPARTQVMAAIAKALAGRSAEAKAELQHIAGGNTYSYLLDNIYPLLRRVECSVEYTCP